MTNFEIQTIQNLDKGRKGDPDTLLALAVTASGNKRDFKSYKRIKKRIRGVVEKLRPEIAKTTVQRLREIHTYDLPIKKSRDSDDVPTLMDLLSRKSQSLIQLCDFYISKY